jgi:hypothetical protein
MRLLNLLLGVTLILYSCQQQEEPKICNVEVPLTDLIWLKNLLTTAADSDLSIYSYLIQGSYQNQTVFILGNCCPFCNWMPVVLDCQGNPVQQATLFDVMDQKVIWRPKESVCN